MGLMNYTEKYNQLRIIFNPAEKEKTIPGSAVKISSILFDSTEPEEIFLNPNDAGFSENRSFTYPVFVPPDKENRRVVLLLHGLNERSWLKYIPWAYYLSELTGSYVILFPISFHMNRSPEAWKEPRIMTREAINRASLSRNIQMTSFANVALSRRLTDDPRRFFFSGYRTACDIAGLLDSISKGHHEYIPKTSHIDIFSYSIGAFLAEIMMIANPGNLFSQSRMFVFCGGSVFSRMHGTSKLIMDSLAFDTLFKYFMNEFESNINDWNPRSEFFRSNSLGLAFRSMIDINRMRGYREKIIKELRDRICSISLLRDMVIPPPGIIETLDCFNTGRVVEVADFPYEYSHENPFPVSGNVLISRKVDECFERVMSKAVKFFN